MKVVCKYTIIEAEEAVKKAGKKRASQFVRYVNAELIFKHIL
jgi:hypothetical protein